MSVILEPGIRVALVLAIKFLIAVLTWVLNQIEPPAPVHEDTFFDIPL